MQILKLCARINLTAVTSTVLKPFQIIFTRTMENSGRGEGAIQTTYPFYSYYDPSLFPIPAEGGSGNSQSEPLTVLAESSTSASSSIPCHSFKEAKDALGSRVNNMSRKEKRKMIKNKRKRLQRQELSQREQEQKRVVLSVRKQ